MPENEIPRLDKLGRPLKGFAIMSPEDRRKAQARGGRNAHKRGVAHRWTRLEAQEAARLSHIACNRNYQKRRRAELGYPPSEE